MTTNRTLLEKADLALTDLQTDGGYLVAEQAAKFIRLLIKEASLMKLATVTTMRNPKKLLESIFFGSRVLHAGEEAVALDPGDRVKPDLSKTELDAKLFKAEVWLNNETLEDNIERGTLKQTVMELLAARVATDMDEVAINGDTGSVDPFLAVFDGLIVQATTNGVLGGGNPLSKTILKDMVKTMPAEFRRNKAALRFLTSPNAETDYRDSLAERATIVGDRTLEESTPVRYGGINVTPIDMFSEVMGIGNDETVCILTDPKNIVYGIWRKIMLETDKDISAGVLKIVATLRFDVKFAYEPAVVLATGITVS